MNGLVYHVVSGDAYFSGIALVILSALLSSDSHPRLQRATPVGFLIGATAIAISSTAIPYWCYAIAAITSAAWVVSWMIVRWRRGTSRAMAAVWTLLGLIEVPYLLAPTLATANNSQLCVIGDSVTAGEGADKFETWPRLLGRQHKLQVQDISHVGDTVAVAARRVQAVSITASVIVVEIGGNDLLGTTTSAEFGRDLDELLDQLSAPGRQVVMLELPLPPFSHEFGRLQRTIARKYNVKLIPKRMFLSVLAGGDSTLDSIHLNAEGHQLMANMVWKVIQTAYIGKVAG